MEGRSGGRFGGAYFTKIERNGLTQAETMGAYLGGSAFQTVIDNPVTAYRQLVQQYAKDVSCQVLEKWAFCKEKRRSCRSC